MTRLPTGPTLLAGLLSAGAVFADDAVDFSAVYTGEMNSNVDGGLATGSRYLDNLDLTLRTNLGGGTVFLYALYNNGGTFADRYAGDLQVTSNIDAPEAVRLYEAWYEFGNGPWSLRAGLIDLNSEFDVNETGTLFLNSSHGIGADFSQAGRNGPSIFPVTSLAVRGEWRGEGLAARVAVFDGVPGDPDDPSSSDISLGGDDGALLVAEADLPVAERGRLWAGAWRYTASFDRLDGSGRDNGNSGWYAGFEQGFTLAGREASAFLRYGQASEELNPIGDYLGAGLVVAAPFATRPDDKAGLAVASAGIGDPYRQALGSTGSRETIWELSYRAVLSEHIALQPDLQYVVNPAAAAMLDDAMVLALRFTLNW